MLTLGKRRKSEEAHEGGRCLCTPGIGVCSLILAYSIPFPNALGIKLKHNALFKVARSGFQWPRTMYGICSLGVVQAVHRARVLRQVLSPLSLETLTPLSLWNSWAGVPSISQEAPGKNR